MTWVKSRLVRPDGKPVEGQCVTATLVVRPSWLANATTQVIGRTSTNTDADGYWRLNLLPYTDFEGQVAACVYYRINEGGPQIWNVRVPPVEDPATELWMRDILIDPVECPDRFIGINMLSRLHDVDGNSIRNAKPGDFLIKLPSGLWGAGHGPLPLTVTWTPDPDDLMSIYVTVVGFGGGGARVGFGDGTPEETVYTSTPVKHTYTEAGTYVLTATDIAWPGFTGTAKVTVKDHAPQSHAYLDGDDDWVVLLWLDEPQDDTKYTIDWGDGSALEEIKGQNHGRVPPKPRVPHRYVQTGRYEVLVTDLATQRQTRSSVQIGEVGVLITWDTDTRPRTEWRWMATGATWEFQSEGSQPDSGIVTASGIVTRPASHDVDPGDYGFDIREVIAGQVRRSAHRRLIVPTQWDWRMDVAMTWRAHNDPLNIQTVTVTPNGARSRCTVEWGDGAASEVVDPAQPISHQYTLPAPATGWRLRISETEIDAPRVWSRLLGEPRHIGVPTLNARTNGAVDLDIQGIDQDYNDDWYAIAWGDGANPQEVGAIGRWYPANHTYSQPGHYQIMVDGPGMFAPVTRELTVVNYPTPRVTVAEARDGNGKIVDPDRLTAQINVDNTDSGGPCTVRVGDNSGPRPCAEVDSFTHRYGKPGDPAATYHVIVTSDADKTAKGRAAVSIPFGQARTLYFQITGELGSYTITLTVTDKDAAKTAQVQWESGGQPQVVPPSNSIVHTYPSIEEIYDITVSYTDNTESWGTSVEMPFQGWEG